MAGCIKFDKVLESNVCFVFLWVSLVRRNLLEKEAGLLFTFHCIHWSDLVILLLLNLAHSCHDIKLYPKNIYTLNLLNWDSKKGEKEIKRKWGVTDPGLLERVAQT